MNVSSELCFFWLTLATDVFGQYIINAIVSLLSHEMQKNKYRFSEKSALRRSYKNTSCGVPFLTKSILARCFGIVYSRPINIHLFVFK